MRSKGGSSKGSVLGCTNGLSAIAEVLAVLRAGPSPGARAEAEKLAARSPRYTSLMLMHLGSRRSELPGEAAGRAQWYPSRPFDARPFGRVSRRGLVRALP